MTFHFLHFFWGGVLLSNTNPRKTVHKISKSLEGALARYNANIWSHQVTKCISQETTLSGLFLCVHVDVWKCWLNTTATEGKHSLVTQSIHIYYC